MSHNAVSLWRALSVDDRRRVLEAAHRGLYDTPEGRRRLTLWRDQALHTPVSQRLSVDMRLINEVDANGAAGAKVRAEGFAPLESDWGIFGVTLLACVLLAAVAGLGLWWADRRRRRQVPSTWATAPPLTRRYAGILE